MSEDDTEHTECAVCGYKPDPDRVPPHYVLSLSDEDTDDEFVQSYPFGGSLSVPFACSDECWLDAQDDPDLISDGGAVENDTEHVPPKFQGTATKSDEFGLHILTLSGRCSCGATDWGIAPDWKVPAEYGGGYMTSNCPECLGTMEYSEQWERVDRLVSDYSELKPRTLQPGIEHEGSE